MSELPEAVRNLSDGEKYELLDALWVDLAKRGALLTEAQEAELKRRVAAYREHPEDVVPWEELSAELFRR